MITARIRIGNGDILDTRDRVTAGDGLRGLIYLDSDKRVGAE